MKPRVTIVTPSYNQGRFIRTTIESVLGQDYPNLEYIVMDGGSTDETASVVRDYASRLRWISEKDTGQANAINKGFRMASGEFVAWLNSDDVLLPGAVSKAVAGFAECRRAGAVYGEGYLIDKESNITGRFPFTQRFDLWRLIHVSDYILQQSTFFRRDAVAEAGYLREDLHYALDWDLLIRIGKRAPLHYIPEYLGCIREHSETKTSSGGWRRIAEIGRVLREHSGRTWPPGLLVYGLGTLSENCCAQIEGWRPARSSRLSRLLQSGTRFVLEYSAGLFLRCPQGVHDDGWVAERASFLLPDGHGDIVVEGFSPPPPPIERQAIEVSIEGLPVGVYRVNAGHFRIQVDSGRQTPEGPLELELCARRTLIRAEFGLRGDGRSLSFQLRDVHWLIDEQGGDAG